MSSLRFSSFITATVPLSRILIDDDVDIRPYYINAGGIRAPVSPGYWDRENFPWPGDTAPALEISMVQNLPPALTWTNSYARAKHIYVTVYCTGVGPLTPQLSIGGVVVETGPTLYTTEQWVSGTYWVNTNQVVSITSTDAACLAVIDIDSTGERGPPYVLSLSGRWLRMGSNMQGLTPTIKITLASGVSINPAYTDYVQYFPLKPDSLNFAGTWTPTQIRPTIEVYKEG